MKHFLAIIFALALFLPQYAFAAVGCTLSNPAEDLKYLFPDLTTYKEELRNLSTMPEGKKLYQDLQSRLGSDLDPLYESFETPYTVYSIFKGEEKIGVVHGVNVPGKGGVIQVFLSTDPKTGEIKSFFFQRLESLAATELRKKEFRDQFHGLTLADFYKRDYYVAINAAANTDKVAAIKPPVLDASGQTDYQATLRGVRKDLILLDFFVYNRRFEPFFEKAKKAIADKASEIKK